MRKILLITLVVVALGAGTVHGARLVSPPVDAPGVKIEAAMGSPLAPAREKSTAYLKVSLEGLEIQREGRAPVNMCLVIDRSGSMAGQKIADARAAAVMAVEKLGPKDLVSVVAYNENAEVLVQPGEVGDGRAICRAIMGLEAGGNTALHAGVSLGAAQLRKCRDDERVSRLILLSDGLANVGPSSTADLVALGNQCANEGMTVSTIGLGYDYNEDLMARMATAAGGGHYFAKTSDELPGIYALELGNLVAVIAKEAVITVECTEGVRPVRVVGREASIDGQNVTVPIGLVYGGAEKYAILEVELPAREAGESHVVAKAAVAFVSTVDNRQYTRNGLASITWTGEKTHVKERINRDVMVSVMRQIAMEKNRLAMEAMDEGNSGLAVPWYVDNASTLQEWGERLDSPELLKDAEENRKDAESIQDGTYTQRRKTILYNQINTFKQEGAKGRTAPPTSVN